MLRSHFLLFTLFSSFLVSSQEFVSDSLMGIYVESGFADKNFIPEGKEKKDVRIGKWNDYTFEFILTYKQEEDFVNEYLEHLLIQSTGKYTDGKKNGLWEFNAVEAGTFSKYHIADVNYIDDKRNGPVTFYFSGGEKAASGNYVNDLLEGELIVYYKTGEVERKCSTLNDEIQGVVNYFYKTGELKYKINYIDSKQSGSYTGYYENGAIKVKKFLKNDTLQGKSTFYYPSGQIREEASYLDGVIEYWKYYYESGQLWVHHEYKDGEYYNIVALYSSLGKHLDFGTLKDGTGTVKYYTEEGKVYLVRTFENGKVINEQQF